jgi:WD40 repeat protein
MAWLNDVYLATASEDETTRAWDIRTGRTQVVLTGHTAPVLSVTCSPTGHVATAGDDGCVIIWETGSKTPVRRIRVGQSVFSAAWSSDGRRLATLGNNYIGDLSFTVQVWDPATGRNLRTFTADSFGGGAMAWSPDGRYLAITNVFLRLGVGRGTIRVWDGQGRGAVMDLDCHRLVQLGGSPGDMPPLRSLEWSPDGRLLAGGAKNGTVTIWNDKTHKVQESFTGSSSVVEWLCWSPNGRYLAAQSNAGTARIWDPTTGIMVSALNWSVQAAAWSPDSSALVTGGDDGTVWRADIPFGEYSNV